MLTEKTNNETAVYTAVNVCLSQTLISALQDDMFSIEIEHT